MSGRTLGDAFDSFTKSAFRMETLPTYDVPEETANLAAYRAGRPLAERSVRTQPWLARMAATTAAGKDWQRLRLVSTVPTLYERYEIAGYPESQACGEQIRLLRRDEHPDVEQQDWWLFDAGTADAACWVMRYTDDGAFLGADLADEDTLRACEETARLWERAQPLNAFLADLALSQHRTASASQRNAEVSVTLPDRTGIGEELEGK